MLFMGFSLSLLLCATSLTTLIFCVSLFCFFIVHTGHLHLLMLSVCAAVAPLSGQDKLYLEKGEEHEPAAGLFVKATPGLTAGAEMQNGRLAMLGLIALVGQSVMTQTPILDVISTGTGHVLF